MLFSVRVYSDVSNYYTYTDTELEAAAEEYFRRHKLTSGKGVLRSLLGWLRSHYKCTEHTMQMLKVLNSE